MGRGLITLLTDYGSTDSYVGQVKGVIKSLAPETELVDISHHIPPGNVFHAARVIAEAALNFPSETIHFAVVDPGVGGQRRRLIVRARFSTANGKPSTHTFVAPDNGLLSFVYNAAHDIKAWSIEQLSELPRQISANTFDGRNVFAPISALLSLGASPDQFGPKIFIENNPLIKLPIPMPVQHKSGEIEGCIVSFDHFGNAATNIPASLLQNRNLRMRISNNEQTLDKVEYFSQLVANQAAFLVNSQQMIEIVVNLGSARENLELSEGQEIRLFSS